MRTLRSNGTGRARRRRSNLQMVGLVAYYSLAVLKLTGALERPAALSTELWILGFMALLAWTIINNGGKGPRSPVLAKQVAELIAFPLRQERRAA